MNYTHFTKKRKWGRLLIHAGERTNRPDLIQLGAQDLKDAGLYRMAANIGYRGMRSEQGLPYSEGRNSEAGHLAYSMNLWRQGNNLQHHPSVYQTPYGTWAGFGNVRGSELTAQE